MLRLRAREIHPVTAPPIADGAVLVGGDGRIACVGPDAAVPAPDGAERLEFPDAAIVPGLVNTHTHLELTHLAGRNGEREFPRWIRRVRELKDATSPDEFAAAAEQGVREAWAAGVTTVADTGSTGAVAAALARLGGRGIAYQEVFGPAPEQAAAGLAELERAVAALARHASPRVRIGVSPHAPYTVSAELYRAAARFARSAGLPLAVHLAESREETAFVRDGAGPFADALRARGVPVRGSGRSPVAHLAALGVLGADTLCIHCVQVDDADVGMLAAAGAAVAHCPVSNRAHGHGTAPFARLRAGGVRVGLGTDSVVSVGALDLWAECRAAGLAGADALRALTLEGARALGWERDIGSLEAGKWADLAVLPAVPRGAGSPGAALLTVIGGRVVQGRHAAAPGPR